MTLTRRLFVATLLSVLIVLATPSCVSTAPHPSPDPVVLDVENGMSQDMTIFVARSGVKGARVGIAPGNKDTRFAVQPNVLPPYVQISLVALSHGERPYFSDEFTVIPGAHVTFTLNRTTQTLRFAYKGEE